MVNNLSVGSSVFDIRFDPGAPLYFVAFYTPNNQAFDLTGYNAKFQVKPSPFTKVLLLEWGLDTTNGGLKLITGDTVTSNNVPVVGAMGVEAREPADVTDKAMWRKAYYRLDLIDTGGNVLPFMKGLLVPVRR